MDSENRSSKSKTERKASFTGLADTERLPDGSLRTRKLHLAALLLGPGGATLRRLYWIGGTAFFVFRMNKRAEELFKQWQKRKCQVELFDWLAARRVLLRAIDSLREAGGVADEEMGEQVRDEFVRAQQEAREIEGLDSEGQEKAREEQEKGREV